MNQTQYWEVFHLVYYGDKHHLDKIEEKSKEIFSTTQRKSIKYGPKAETFKADI